MEVDPGDGLSSSLTKSLVFGDSDLIGETDKQVLMEKRQLQFDGKSSLFETCFNGINALSGVGILSVPYALASGGWLSLALLFIIASSTCFTGLLMRRCMDVNSNIRTFPDIGGHAFGQRGRTVVSVFMYLELYMAVTGFLIIEGDNLHNLFPNIRLEFGGIRLSGQSGFIIIVSLIILPSALLKDVSMLSYVSASGVLASVITVCVVLWVGAIDGVGFHEKGKVLNLSGIPGSVSLYAFCYCAHPVFPTLYTSMKDKRQFNKVLLFSFVPCTIIYASIAVAGYMMFGDLVESQVTLNLPTNKLSSKIGIYITLVNPLTKYALMVSPIVSALESSVPPHYGRSVSLMIRTMFLISTVVVSLSVPFFGLLMSLVGAFLSATTSIIFPCVCYVKITRAYRRWGYELVIIFGILLLGISVVVIGTFTSLQQIASQL